MQALILFSRNIGGIGGNPEGENGAYPAPRPCGNRKLVRTLPRARVVGRTCFQSARIVTGAINIRLIPLVNAITSALNQFSNGVRESPVRD